MDESGHDILARTAFAQNNDVAVCRRNSLDGLHDRLHRRTSGNHAAVPFETQMIQLSLHPRHRRALLGDDLLPFLVVLHAHVGGYDHLHVAARIQDRNAVRNAGIFGAIGQRGYRVLLRLDGGQGGRLIVNHLL